MTITQDHVFVRSRAFGPVEPAPAGQGVVGIPLLNGGVMIVDACDAGLATLTWRRLDSGRTSYAYTRACGRKLYAHALIAGQERLAATGRAVGVVDHIDGDGLNNRRANLRTCDHSRNIRNSVGRPAARKSRFKGVTPGTGTNAGKWRATIHVDGRQRHLGYFGTEVEAARAYDRAAIEHFGEFARLNFPDSLAA